VWKSDSKPQLVIATTEKSNGQRRRGIRTAR
jgi:hypothetical protein